MNYYEVDETMRQVFYGSCLNVPCMLYGEEPIVIDL